eukprot:jgi/Astpho2/9636/e_gw1.00146.147.1_t
MTSSPAGSTHGTFLDGLATAFNTVDRSSNIQTMQFAKACEAILPVFDKLGTIFSFAKSELISKRETLEQIAPKLPTLNEVVAADKKAGTVTVKNSPSRNLHRLLSSVSFIAALLQNLAADPKTSLHTAAASAYNNTMSPMHNFMVRTAVKASFYTLPTRAGFLESIGETERTAKDHAAHFVPSASELVKRVEALFDGTQMPKSDTTWTG